MGFLAENVALYHRRAERLVRFYGALNSMGGSYLKKRAKEALEAVGLQDLATRNVGKFSRGMLQRIGLAQALVNDPELLILDEPTSALDPLARVAVREFLLHAREQGKTIFLSSHLLSEVELVCDRVAVLHRGKMMRLGTTHDLLKAGEQMEIVASGICRRCRRRRLCVDGIVSLHGTGEHQRAAVERVWSLGGSVISVNPVRRSLEQMFIEVTSDKDIRKAKREASPIDCGQFRAGAALAHFCVVPLGLVFGIPGFGNGHSARTRRLLFIFKQVAVYVVVFSIFFGGLGDLQRAQIAPNSGRVFEGNGPSAISFRPDFRRYHRLRDLLLHSGTYRKLDSWPGRFSHADCMVFHGLPALGVHAGRDHCADVLHFF